MEVKKANNIRLQLLRESVSDFKHTLNLSGNNSFEEFFEYKTVGTISKVKRSPLTTQNKIDSPNTRVQKFIEKVQRNISEHAQSISKPEVTDSPKEIFSKSSTSTCSIVGESASKRQKFCEKMIENVKNISFDEINQREETVVELRRNSRERKDTNESEYYDTVEDIENEPFLGQRFSINLSEVAGRRRIPKLRRSISETHNDTWERDNSWLIVPESAVKILVEVSS